MNELYLAIGKLIRSGTSYDDILREVKRSYLEWLIESCRGNQCRAARVIGVHRNTMNRLVHELGIDTRSLRYLPTTHSTPTTTERK